MTGVDRTKFVSFRRDGVAGWGLWSEAGIIDLSARFPSLRAAITAGALRDLAQVTGDVIAHEDVTLEIPVTDAEKYICIGVNFPDRNAEYKDGSDAPKNPSIFLRYARSFVGDGANILRPPESPQLDYEGEICVVIGKQGRRISEADAFDHIAGLTLCNEGTLRDWVRHAKFNVTQGKNFDASGAMGPWMVMFEDATQLDDVALTTRVNGEIRQEDRTSRMMFPFRRLIAYVSTFTTLVPGDVIICGTPTGAGARFDPPKWLVPGDVVEVEAEGIGILRNSVADET